MDDFILTEGDQVTFLPNFGAAIVAVHPGQLRGSGSLVLNGKKVCVDGDQDQVSLPGCPYVTPQYSIPGIGTLKIASLAPNQKAHQTTTSGKALLLKGGDFIAKFEVQNPAKQPPPGPGAPVPDPTRQYAGIGRFVTTNAVLKTS